MLSSDPNNENSPPPNNKNKRGGPHMKLAKADIEELIIFNKFISLSYKSYQLYRNSIINY